MVTSKFLCSFPCNQFLSAIPPICLRSTTWLNRYIGKSICLIMPAFKSFRILSWITCCLCRQKFSFSILRVEHLSRFLAYAQLYPSIWSPSLTESRKRCLKILLKYRKLLFVCCAGDTFPLGLACPAEYHPCWTTTIPWDCNFFSLSSIFRILSSATEFSTSILEAMKHYCTMYWFSAMAKSSAIVQTSITKEHVEIVVFNLFNIGLPNIQLYDHEVSKIRNCISKWCHE